MGGVEKSKRFLLGLLTTESLNEEEDEDRETEGFTSLRIEHESIGFRRDE